MPNLTTYDIIIGDTIEQEKNPIDTTQLVMTTISDYTWSIPNTATSPVTTTRRVYRLNLKKNSLTFRRPSV